MGARAITGAVFFKMEGGRCPGADGGTFGIIAGSTGGRLAATDDGATDDGATDDGATDDGATDDDATDGAS